MENPPPEGQRPRADYAVAESRSFGSRDSPCVVLSHFGDEAAADFFEQPFWQQTERHTCGIALPRRAQVRPRPKKAIGFGQYHPGAFVIEAKAALGSRWNFNCISCVPWRRMGDREHRHDFIAVVIGDSQNDSTGAILDALFLSLEMLIAPEIAVADDEARGRFG